MKLIILILVCLHSREIELLKENKPTSSSVKESTPCNTDEDCYINYTPGLDIALQYNSSIVNKPKCILGWKAEPSDDLYSGTCSCMEDCKSFSTKTSGQKFYYCGRCGRVGSQCSDAVSCSHEISRCSEGYCQCKDNGLFYDLYYCYIPYYGYQIALQMAIATCIIIAGCLLLVSAYNAIGLGRLRRIQNIRDLLRGDVAFREFLANDIPPKYDDVVEDLPTYQDALQMNQEGGIPNPSFEDHEKLEAESQQSTITSQTASETRRKYSGHCMEGSSTTRNQQFIFRSKLYDGQLPKRSKGTAVVEDSRSHNSENGEENDPPNVSSEESSHL